jgi:methylmalonyl-CoA mutase
VDSDNKLNLKGSFPPPSYEEWLVAVKESLKGADFDKVMKTKTEEGIVLQPLYRKDDIAGLSFTDSVPGSTPFIRGNDPEKFLAEGWLIAQSHKGIDPEKLNEQILKELNLGLTAVNISLEDGLELNSPDKLETMLKGIDLKAAPLFMQLGIADTAVLSYFAEYAAMQGLEPKALEAGLGIDITGEFARQGFLEYGLEETWQRMLDAVKANLENTPRNRVISIDGTIYEASGASSVQELAFVLSTAIGYIQGLQYSGFEIDQLAPMMQVKLSLGSNFFMEIAKIRAFRLLWAEMMKAFGAMEINHKIWIHGKTARFNKSLADLYVNVLRAGTESFAGVIGGVDSLETDCFDDLVNPDAELSRRMARNQQVILKEEAHFAKVVDPAGGCYYIESLTNELAGKAWALMQEIEGAGGMVRCLRAGRIHDYIEGVAKSRIDAVNKRKSVFVGVNMFANPQEQIPHTCESRYLSEGEVVSGDSRLHMNEENGRKEGKKAIILERGALPVRRAMEEVESLRMKVETSTGNKKILLLNMGSVAEYKARADFASGFFQVAGFEVISPNGLVSVDEAIKTADESGAGAYCICSTDDNYVDLVPELGSKLKGKTLILAGYPTEKVEEYKAAGISCFIHLRADVVATLHDLALQMGVIG